MQRCLAQAAEASEIGATLERLAAELGWAVLAAEVASEADVWA